MTKNQALEKLEKVINELIEEDEIEEEQNEWGKGWEEGYIFALNQILGTIEKLK